MFKKTHSSFLIVLFFTAFSLQMACAANAPSSNSGADQDQESFPFDNACLKYDKTNFKVGPALLDVMSTGDFPQYCVLYSLSNYQMKQKGDDGYFIIGSKPGLQHAQDTVVFLKSNKNYAPLQPVSPWAYFVGPQRFMMANGQEQEIYVFQEKVES